MGVTGRNVGNCFVAGIDRLLPGQKVDPDFYTHYLTEVERISAVRKGRRNPHFLRLYDELQDQVGGEPFLYARLTSAEQLHAAALDADLNGYELVLDMDFAKDVVHSLGLHVIDKRRAHYRLSSTHTPPALRGVVTLDYVYPFLAQPPDPPSDVFPFNDANVAYVPQV